MRWFLGSLEEIPIYFTTMVKRGFWMHWGRLCLAVFISSWTRCLTAVLHYDRTFWHNCKDEMQMATVSYWICQEQTETILQPRSVLVFFLLIKFALLKWLVLPLRWGYNVGVCMLKASCDRYSLRLFNVHSLSVLGKVTFKSNALQYCVTP